MNTENLFFLLDSVKYLGFGEKGWLCDQLEEKIKIEQKEFQLYAEVFYEEVCKLETTLYFRKGDNHEMYFFNKYEAVVHYLDHPERERRQTFYISKGRGVTRKEAFNLLEGRAVNKNLYTKDGVKYNAWIQLNFTEKEENGNFKTRKFSTKYGYDLEKILEKYAISELTVLPLREGLIRSLKRGNLHPVTFTKDRKASKMLIEACPQFKTINIYPYLGETREIPIEQEELETAAASADEDMQSPFWGDEEDGQEEEEVAEEDVKQAAVKAIKNSRARKMGVAKKVE